MAVGTRGTLAIPEAENEIPASTSEEVDQAVADLNGVKDAWVALDIPERIKLLDEMIDRTAAVAERWAVKTAGFTGTPPGTHGWFILRVSPVITIRHMRLLREALQDILEHGHPQLPGEPYTRPDGQVAVPIFPTSMYDRAAYDRVTGEVWMDPEVRLEDVTANQARIYREHGGDGKVALVLGAGNVSAIPATDVLSKLFSENEVCALKMNPVNEAVGPVIAEAFQPLIDHGFLRVLYGGVEVGKQLTDHPDVDTIHLTGSDKTFEAIVFGPGEEGQRRKEQRDPRLRKPVTAELGNVSPVIVVPGPWSDADIAYHSRNLASMLTNNAGFNCIALRAIVTHSEWGRRRQLLDGVRAVLASTPQAHPYYPGARDRWERFVDEHPEAERFGREAGEAVPWTLIPEVDPENDDEICFDTEAFCGVTCEVPLDAPRDVAAYLDRAVEFCNERLWGTLGASILIHPRSLNDPEVEEAFERALTNLRYGSVVVNHWMGMPFALMSPPWGAYPGHDIYDIQSGIGWVHNTYMLDRPQKAVIRGPFRPLMDPPWFVTHPHAPEVGTHLTSLEADPSPANLAKVAAAAMRDGQGLFG